MPELEVRGLEVLEFLLIRWKPSSAVLKMVFWVVSESWQVTSEFSLCWHAGLNCSLFFLIKGFTREGVQIRQISSVISQLCSVFMFGRPVAIKRGTSERDDRILNHSLFSVVHLKWNCKNRFSVILQLHVFRGARPLRDCVWLERLRQVRKDAPPGSGKCRAKYFHTQISEKATDSFHKPQEKKHRL